MVMCMCLLLVAFRFCVLRLRGWLLSTRCSHSLAAQSQRANAHKECNARRAAESCALAALCAYRWRRLLRCGRMLCFVRQRQLPANICTFAPLSASPVWLDYHAKSSLTGWLARWLFLQSAFASALCALYACSLTHSQQQRRRCWPPGWGERQDELFELWRLNNKILRLALDHPATSCYISHSLDPLPRNSGYACRAAKSFNTAAPNEFPMLPTV